jgi:hypothetical protein
MDSSDDISSLPAFIVTDRDPLGADRWVACLPERNARGDAAGVLEILRILLPAGERVAAMDLRDGIAAVRDLGIVCGSLRRHGIEPVEALPELEPILLMLGEKTDMIPRDTVFHYGAWNPRGALDRRFTDDPQELALKDAGRMAAPKLEEAVGELERLVDAPLDAPEVVNGLARAHELLGALIAAITLAREKVTPIFFARTLRPYFDAIRVKDKSYGGVSAVPLSVGLVDHFLWSSDCEQATYRAFQDDTMIYNVPRMRRLYAKRLGRPSLVTRLLALSTEARSTTHRASVSAARALLKRLIAFRSPHVSVAKAAYNAEIRKFPVGSGGYGVDMLMLILRLAADARKALHSELEAASE